MKRLRSALLFFLVTVLTVSMMMGSFGVFAFATEGGDELDAQLFSGTMQTRVQEGEYFNIPTKADGVEVAVYNPVGAVIEMKTNGYKADSLGNYKVTYTNGRNSYSYNVHCYASREYFINVKETKSDFLPTYVATAATAGSKIITVPSFELAYKNSKGEIVVMPTNVDTLGYDVTGATKTVNGIAVPTEAGTITLTFWGKTGENTTKTFTKEYTINVQKGFSDTTAPSLTTLTMPSAMNINSLYTLPVATANESNVFIEVKVIGPSGAVKEYKADADGYADLSTEGSEIIFDNNNVKTFYPTELGSYKITYTAIDGSGNESTPHDYIVDCKDKLAPKITEFAADLIPTNWGLENVYKLAADGETEIDTDLGFYLPFPTATDNADVEDDLRLVITLTNPGTGTAGTRTIGRWDDKISEYKAGNVKVDSGYASYFVQSYRDTAFKPEGGKVPFSFENIDFENNSNINKDSEKFGNWTLTYTIYDSQSNGGSGTARRTATINLSSTFTDKVKPEINTGNLDIPSYILIKEENNSFKVPQLPWLTDADEALTVNYTITSDATFTAGAKVEFDGVTYDVVRNHNVKSSDGVVYGGQTYNIEYIDAPETANDGFYMLISEGINDYAFKLGNLITLDFEANDDVGNVSETEPVEINVFYANEITEETLEAEFFHYEDETVTEIVDGEEKEVTRLTRVAGLNLEDGLQKVKMNLGGFIIRDIENIDYTGYEISILDPSNMAVEFSLNTYRRANGDLFDIYVNDIAFTPYKSEYYRINVRIFDISGNSTAYGHTFFVERTVNDETGVATAAAIKHTGEVRTQYELTKSYAGLPAGDNVIIREIKGYTFSLMSNVFVGYDSGAKYEIEDFVAIGFNNLVNENGIFQLNDTFRGQNSRKTYAVRVENKETPVVEIHGIFPKTITELTSSAAVPGTYSESGYIVLPAIIGYTSFENATISLTVTLNSKTITNYKVYVPQGENLDNEDLYTFEEKTNGVPNNFTGRFAFAATENGNYTVQIKATASSNTHTPSPYTIKIGPRVPVSFEVSPTLSAKVGDTFYWTAPVIDANASSSTTINITLTDEDGKQVASLNINKTDADSSNFADNYANSSFKFTSAGNYKLKYTVTSQYGDVSTAEHTIVVDETSPNFWEETATLTIILIIVGILLIVGVVVYIVRFRTVKK